MSKPLTEEQKEKIKSVTHELKSVVMQCARKYGIPETLSGLVIVTLAGFEASGIPFEVLIEVFRKTKEQTKGENKNGE